MGMICTPIFINTFVVFVRLYWFERRFQNIVREARNFRRTKSRSKTEPVDDVEPSYAEAGLRGRNIVVLHNGDVDATSNGKRVNTDKPDTVDKSDTSEDTLHAVNGSPQQPSTLRRDITFADEVIKSEGEDSRPTILPQRLSPESHLKFLENQRNPKDRGTLRIPGPRDFDRGSVPEPLNDDIDGGQLTDQLTSPLEMKETVNEDGVKRKVTSDEPDHPHLRAKTGTFPKFSVRKSGDLEKQKSAPTDDNNAEPNRLRARTGTFSSLQGWGSTENESLATPYLSWQPTIGRNSKFIDLTEEQREELGGIEYRSLKTLAIVLVCELSTLLRLAIYLANSVDYYEAYYVLFHLLGVVILVPWIIRTDTWGSIIDKDGQSRTWWYETRPASSTKIANVEFRGIFTPQTMFNDVGFTLTPDSMASFQEAVVPLLLGSFLIVIGNTGFPCMLRFVIWITSNVVPRSSGVWEEFRFLLDHPRRCFTLLFPGLATWWLFWVLVVLNGVDMIFFIILDVCILD